MKVVRTVLFSVKFFRIVDGNILQKAAKTIKYSPRFHYHLTLQQATMKNNIQERRKAEKAKQIQNVQYYKTLMNKYFQIRQKFIKKGKENFEQIKDEDVRESVIKNLMKEGFQKMSLFYQSLQNLVEGRREVLQNQEFVFDDGESVREKKLKFEKHIERFFGKKASKEEQKRNNEQFQ